MLNNMWTNALMIYFNIFYIKSLYIKYKYKKV